MSHFKPTRASHNSMIKSGADNTNISAQTNSNRQSLHIGPIPAADELISYGNLNSSFPERIMQMAEKNVAHRIACDTEVLAQNRVVSKNAFTLALIAQIIGSVIVLSLTGLGIWGAIIGSLNQILIGFIGATITTGLTGLFRGLKALHHPEKPTKD